MTIEVNPFSGGGGGGAVDSVNGMTGVVVLTKASIGLSNVNNTSDANKPVSTAQQAAIDLATSGTANVFAAYDGSGVLDEYSPMSVNGTGGIDLTQPVAPAATGGFIKYNNAYFPASPSVDSDENWYADWREPRILDTGFSLGDPLTGNGGLNGLGMAMTALGSFGYLRNFDFSIQVGNGVDPVAGYSVAAMNQYINVDNNATVEQVRGFPISISGQAGSSIADIFGTSLNINIADCTGSITGWQLGGNAAFTGLGTQFTGLDVSGTVTGVVTATGLNINMGGVTASGVKRAINTLGDVYIDGAFALTGAFTVGKIDSSSTIAVADSGGAPATNNGIGTQITGSGVVANCDTIGLATPSNVTLDATFVGTSGGFGIGIASLALPNIISMAAGCSLDNLTSAAYANVFDAGNTGGTIDRLVGCRSVNLSQGGTQTITRMYNFFADFFAGDIAVDSWGYYDNGAKYNWMANALKIGGASGSTDVVTNSSIGLELHDRALRLATMDTAARNALTAVAGMVIFNTTTSALEYYDGAAWV